MKSMNKLALILATAVFASTAGAQEIHNWRSGDGQVWKNADGQCWRDASWTPATAVPGCDGYIAPKVDMPVPPPPPKMEPKVEPKVEAPKPEVKAPVVPTKVNFSADALFDFNKSVLKAEGKAKLDDLVGKLKDVNLEAIVSVGHTDSVGSDAYNQKLSMRRAEAVKAYLVSKGVDSNRVYTEGKGEKEPVASNATAAGRAENRRAVIEVVGTRAGK